MFIGAGLSKSAGYADWKDLLRCAAKDLDLDVERENLVSLAQYYCNKYGNRNLLNDTIFGEFSKTKPVDENHKIIARLPISCYWTTNYDSLIEDALNEEKKIVDVKHRNEHLSLNKPHRDAILYKMHGDKSDPNNAILIKDDYEQYYRKHAQFIAALSDDLISKTFLFVGFSFSNPNIDYILSRIQVEYGDQNSRQHYAIMRKAKECDFNNRADYEYAQRKHDLFVEDLKRHNIKALLIDEYSEITGILEEISKRLNRSNVFISGSAHEYNEGGYSEREASDFIRQLSKELIAQGFNIVSGFGLGVGSSVIFGALQEIYINQKSTLKDRLILRPFPQGIEDAAAQQDLWNKYREDMISRAGVSVFLFGNKLDADTGKVILADGVEAEFDIAFEKGNLLVPVGCTGYVARELWNKIRKDMSEYYTDADDALTAAFNKLNAKSDSLVNDIISFIKLFENERYKPVCNS